MMANTEFAAQQQNQKMFKAYKGQAKSLEGLSFLLQTINQYSSNYADQNASKLSISDLASQRFAQLELMNGALDELSRSCLLAQAQKLDCLEQVLRAIKLLHGMSERKPARASVSAKQNYELMRVLAQKEMNIIQKLSDLVLQVSIPDDVSPKNLTQIAAILFELFFSIKLGSNQEPKNKEKVRKRQCALTITTIQYCLLSGKKINLIWLIIFRVLQRKNYQIISQNKSGRQSLMRDSVTECIETNIKKSIKALFNFIKSINECHIIFKSLLVCLVENIKEMELSIIPIMLSVYFDTVVYQFKDAFVLHGSIPSQLFLGRALYCLESLNLFCDLIKTAYVSMSEFSMQKMELNDRNCSYCGLNLQKGPTQTIRVALSNHEQLSIRVCHNCCQELGFQPENQLQVMAFAPIIFSRFWDWDNRANVDEIRLCIKQFLIYHGSNPCKRISNKSKKNLGIEIPEQIAMNNVDESVSVSLIEGVYQAFLFNHSKISIKKVLYQILNILLIAINSAEEKVRQKTLKTLNQSHIIAFIFNSSHKTPSLYAQEINNFKDKFMAIILIKLRDFSVNVKVTALELVSNIYSKEQIQCNLKIDFYQTIYKEIAFSNSPEYIAKSVNIIEKSIFKMMKLNNHQELLGFVQIVIQAYYFCQECIVRLKKCRENLPLKNQICKLINKLLQAISQICTTEFEYEEEQRIGKAFKEGLGMQCFANNDLKSIYDSLIMKTLQERQIDREIMKSIPKIGLELIDNLVSYSGEQQTEQKVGLNLLHIINLVFEDVFQARQAVDGKKQKQYFKHPPMFNLKQLREYLFSHAFFEKLLSNKTASNRIKETVLNELFTICNFCNQINDQKSSLGCIKMFIKNKSKWRNCIDLHFSEALSQKFLKLVEVLYEQIKTCTIGEITAKVNLINNVLFFFHLTDQIGIYISNYYRYTTVYITNMVSSIRQFEQGNQKSELYTSILNTYANITRIIIILTSLATSYEKFICLENFLRTSEQAKSRNSTKADKNQDQSKLKPSTTFENCYKLVVNILQIEFCRAKTDARFQVLFKHLILHLNSYWELYPDIIVNSSHLLKQLITNIDERGFIKGIYKLFLMLLPCNDARILSIINHNFSASFHQIFDNMCLRKDRQMIEYCFMLLQHMLKSGMTGLYQFNRYIYCGLLHDSQVVNNISTQIIKQIYANEASEKMLFVNLPESLKFIYHFYFEPNEDTKPESIQLLPQQKLAIKMIANITKTQSKCFLTREKRELRIKATFMKKLSEIILNKDGRLLHENPLYLLFLIKLIKCQDCFDYSQLYQILFTINKVSTDNYSFINHLREELEDYDQWTTQNLKKSMNIYFAYREVVSCLTYLSAYQPVKKQLANYNRLFDTSNVPYATLKEDLPLERAGFGEPINNTLLKIGEDVDLHFDIAVGVVECVVDQKKQPQKEDEDSWSQTNETKPKGKKSKGRQQSASKNQTKNRRKQCMSAQKKRITRRCAKQNDWSGNTSSIGMSEESIY